MLKRLFPIVLCTIIAFGCGKKDSPVITNPNTGNPTKPTVKEDSTYIMAGLTDFSFDAFVQTKSLMVALSPMSSAQPHITLSLEGLPKGVTANFATPGGIVPFVTDLNIKNDHGEGGTYDIKLIGTSDAGLKKTLIFKMTVPTYSCYNQMADKNNDIHTSRHTMQEGIKDPNISTSNLGVGFYDGYVIASSVYIDSYNSYENYVDIKATVNCDNKTLTVVADTYTDEFTGQEYQISGTGNFDIAKGTLTMNIVAVNSRSQTFNYTIKHFFQ